MALAASALPVGAGMPSDPLEGICGMSPAPGDADGLVAPQGPFIFDGFEIWNVTAEDQSIAAALAPGSAAKFVVLYRNDDDVTHDIVVRGDLDGDFPPPGFVVKAFRSSNHKDVTDKVFGLSGLRLRNVAANGESSELLVRIKMQTSANPSAFVEAFITGNYEVASFCGDTVRVSAGAP